MITNFDIKLSDVREFAKMRNISQKEASKILLHEGYVKIYGNHKCYPKEIHKIVFEDKNCDTRYFTTKIIY